jgi:hypothetical protein
VRRDIRITIGENARVDIKIEEICEHGGGGKGSGEVGLCQCSLFWGLVPTARITIVVNVEYNN